MLAEEGMTTDLMKMDLVMETGQVKQLCVDCDSKVLLR